MDHRKLTENDAKQLRQLESFAKKFIGDVTKGVTEIESVVAEEDLWTCIVPPGAAGEAKIEEFEVSEGYSLLTALRRSYIPPGKYKRLLVKGELMMSDTPKEKLDHLEFLTKARGKVLITGLGMGCCLNCVLRNPNVESVTVIEKSQDAIDLVGSHFPSARIIQGDALKWKPAVGETFDVVWHDIWPSISDGNLPAMKSLTRRYSQYGSPWQGCWCRKQCKKMEKEFKMLKDYRMFRQTAGVHHTPRVTKGHRISDISAQADY